MTNDEIRANHMKNTTNPSTGCKPAEIKSTDSRESRMWWAIYANNTYFVRGIPCVSPNPRRWWIPDLRIALTENDHLFETEHEAIDKLVDELSAKIEVIHVHIESLRNRQARAQAQAKEREQALKLTKDTP